MEKSNTDRDYLAEAIESLSPEAMARLDFDELRERLAAVCDRLTALECLAAEHACLHEEYQQRIAGMVKAIAAVDRKRGSMEEAVTLVEQLPQLPAEQLLATFRRVAARFRDYFPGSFGSYPAPDRRTNQSPAVGR